MCHWQSTEEKTYPNVQSQSFPALMVLLEGHDTKTVPVHWCCTGDIVQELENGDLIYLVL